MEKEDKLYKRNNLLILVVPIVIGTIGYAYLDVPLLRQFTAILLLYFIPGLLILNLLKLNGLPQLEYILYCVGLSTCYWLILGLFVSVLANMLGVRDPLSLNAITIYIAMSLFILVISCSLIGKSHAINLKPLLNAKVIDKIYIMPMIIYPALSMYAMKQNYYLMLMLLMIFIPIYLIAVSVAHKKLSSLIYPIIIYLISLSIIIIISMLSKYIYGSDSHLEFYLFQKTLKNGSWAVFLNNSLDACLSITVLPAIYKSIMGFGAMDAFKYGYIIPLSFTPLIVYEIAKRYLNSFYSFLASILFMSQGSFYFQTAAYRNYMGVFFFGLCIMVLFNSGMAPIKKKALFILFSFSILVSHYSTAYIYLIILILTYVGVKGIAHLLPEWFYGLRGYFVLDKVFIALFVVMIVFWYGQATGGAFSTGIVFFANALNSIEDILVLESREPTIAKAFGASLGQETTIFYIKLITSWFVVLFVAIGVLGTIVKFKFMIDTQNVNCENRSSFLVNKFDVKFIILSFACSIMLVVSIAIPYLFIGYSLGRAFYQMMVVLSVFFVVGGVYMSRIVKIKHAYLIVIVVLVPYFMIGSGILPQFFNDYTSSIINSPKKTHDFYYTYDSEASGARWLNNYYGNINKIYTDLPGRWRLVSNGLIPPKRINISELGREFQEISDGFIYLRYESVENGELLSYSHKSAKWERKNFYEIRNESIKWNAIYSSMGSEIWKRL